MGLEADHQIVLSSTKAEAQSNPKFPDDACGAHRRPGPQSTHPQRPWWRSKRFIVWPDRVEARECWSLAPRRERRDFARKAWRGADWISEKRLLTLAMGAQMDFARQTARAVLGEGCLSAMRNSQARSRRSSISIRPIRKAADSLRPLTAGTYKRFVGHEGDLIAKLKAHRPARPI